LAKPDEGEARPVGIGTSLFLIAVGAILYFAVDASLQGIDIATVGLILMIIGVLGLAISFYLMSRARTVDRTVVRDRDVY
jgi:hypothetical protein